MSKKVLQTCLLMLIILISTMFNNGFSQTVWDGTSTDVTWYGDGSATVFEISTAAELAGLAQLVNNNTSFSGKTVKLTADIWLNAEGSITNNWDPIGRHATAPGEFSTSESANRHFVGTFDGNGYIIYNMYCNRSYFQAGLFGGIKTSGTTIKNIIMMNPKVIAQGMAGSVVGFAGNGSAETFTIENCHAINCSVTNGSYTTNNFGGIIGACWPTGNSGGVVTITNCGVTGVVSGKYVGGIAGNGNASNISNCYFSGTITASSFGGSIIGCAETSKPATVTNCYTDTKYQSNTAQSFFGVEKTTAYMKSQDLITDLGSAFQMDCGVNNGYPISADYLCAIAIEGPEEVCAGTQVTLTASNGFETYEWKANGTTISGQTGSTITYTVNATTTFTAKSVRASDDVALEGEFTVEVLSAFNFTATIAESYDGEVHGTIAPETASIACTNPSNINYTITPAAGWYVEKVLVDGEAIDFTEGANNVVTGIYTPIAGQHANVVAHLYDKYKITTTLTLNGEPFPNTTLVTPWGTNGVVEVLKGENQLITIGENNLYKVNTVLVDGVSQGEISSYTFTNVQSNHTLTIDYVLEITSNGYWDGSVDVSWYNTSDTEFYMFTPEQLAGLAQLVNEGNDFAGKTVYLMRDMWLNEADDDTNNWTPIGGMSTGDGDALGKAFSGTFEGNNRVIYNLYSSYAGTTNKIGLFGKIKSGSIIRNVHLIDAIVKGQGQTATLVGYIQGGSTVTIENCMSINAYTEVLLGDGGALIGKKGDGSAGRAMINHCMATGTVKGTQWLGGLFGIAFYTTLTDCYFIGKIEMSGTSGTANVGAICGHNSNNVVTNSYSYLDPTGKQGGTSGYSGTTKTLEEMLDPSILDLLNGNNYYYKSDCGINNGYPILTGYLCEIKVDGPTEICANTEIILTAEDGYETYKWTNDQNAEEQNTQSITVSPNATTIYTVVGTKTTPVEVEVTGEHTVTVNPKTNISVTVLSYDKEIHGSVSPMSEEIDCGDTDPVTFTITPHSGWHVAGIYINGELQPNTVHPEPGVVQTYSYTPIDISENIEVHLSNRYPVQASIELTGGSDLDATYLLSPWGEDGTSYVLSGEDLTYTIHETGKYHISNVIVNGENKGRITSYTFENIDDYTNNIKVIYEEGCSVSAIPYYESFDFYGTGAGLAPDCWTYVDSQDESNARIEISSTRYSSAGSSLLMRAGNEANNFTLVQLPAFSDDVDINNLQLLFNMYTSNSAVDVAVGFSMFDFSGTYPIWDFDTLVVLKPTILNAWDDFEVSLINCQPKEGYRLSFKVEHKNATGTNGIYIDDVVVDYLPTCPRPTNVRLEDISDTYAIVSWDAGSTEDKWDLAVVPRDETPVSGTTVYGKDYMALSNLNANTEYDVYVKSLCTSSDISRWSKVLRVKTLKTYVGAATIPYICDFEDDEENSKWTLTNGSQTNKWYIDDFVNNGGSYGLYISNNEGNDNSYSNATTTVYASRDIYVNKAGNYNVSFDWRSNGELFYSTLYDYLRVCLAPIDVNLTAGTIYSGLSGTTMPANWIALDGGALYEKTEWQTMNKEINIGEIGYYKLIFFWRNDGVSNYDPPAAIDNISILSAYFESPLAVIDVNGDVKASYNFCVGNSAADAIAELPKTITIKDEANRTYQVSLTWSIENYNANVADSYDAKATFSLPSDVLAPTTPMAIEVTTNIVLNTAPIVNCSSSTSTTINNTVNLSTLSGISPTGGTFSGAGVSGTTFDPKNLAPGSYTITYTVENASGCTSSCTFSIAVTYPELSEIDVDNLIPTTKSYCAGTLTSEIISELPKQVVLEDSDENTHTMPLAWSIAGYNADVAATYTATGSFVLPIAVSQSNPAKELKVETSITINALPAITCPEDKNIQYGEKVDLTGELEPGGYFVGESVEDNIFNPVKDLPAGTYVITYNKTDATTGCSNSCSFVITISSTQPQLATVDTDNEVEPIEVCSGTTEGVAKSQLARSIKIADDKNNTYTVSLTWSISGYNASAAGTYNATGTFTLPAGVSTNPTVEAKVSTTVKVNALPAVTCPEEKSAVVGAEVVLTGATPAGGEYSGINVNDGKFNATDISVGEYEIVYTYTDPATGCSNSCEFIITISILDIEESLYEGISIYPNPTKGDLTINFGSYEGAVSYVIYDTKGSVIKEDNLHKASGTKDVSLSVQPGVYYIKLITDGEPIVKQIVVE